MKRRESEGDSHPAAKTQLTFIRGLCYDERSIAEFIFIQSEARPLRHMINERTRTGVRQDLFPSSEASEPPQRVRSEISSGPARSLSLPLAGSPPLLPPPPPSRSSPCSLSACLLPARLNTPSHKW